MELWILGAREGLPKDANPWLPVYDKNRGFIIAAETEQRARELADQHAADENRDGNPWLNEKLSTCRRLTAGAEEMVIMSDFIAG